MVNELKSRETTVRVQLTSQSENDSMRAGIDTLVILGAGQFREMDSYLALAPSKILLVEANPLLAKILASRTTHLQQVEVLCAAVAGRPGPVTFYRYNLPDAGAIHPATGLYQLYPGLKLTETVQMQALTPSMLLHTLVVQADHKNHLVLDSWRRARGASVIA